MSPAINCAKGAIGINNAYKRNQVGFGGPSIPPPFCKRGPLAGAGSCGSCGAEFRGAGAEGSGAEFRGAGAEGSGAEFRGAGAEFRGARAGGAEGAGAEGAGAEGAGAEGAGAIAGAGVASPVILLKEFIKLPSFHIP